MERIDLETLRYIQMQFENGNSLLFNHSSVLTGAQYCHLYELCRRYVRPGSRVLDWGAGNGHFSCFLVRSGFQAIGFSLDPYSFRALVSGFPYLFVPGTPSEPTSIPFESSSFDAVFSVGVLEHVRESGGDELGSLREMKRVLRPQGLFICYHLPNRYSWIEAAARSVGRGLHHHKYRYTSKDIRRLCALAGLVLIDFRRYALLPRQQVSRAIPRSWRKSQGLAHAYGILDGLFGMLLSPLCQNYWFVAAR